jgi:hypothetical protein
MGLATACGPATPPTAEPSTGAPPTVSAATESQHSASPPRPAAATRSAPTDIREFWDANYFDQTKVGYSHTRYEPVEREGRSLVRITAESELVMRRYGQSVKQGMAFSSLETPAGEMIECDSRMSSHSSEAGTVEIATKGRVTGDQLVLEVTTLGKTVSTSIPWNKSWGGFFALEQTLERQPMQPGEKRELRALVPGFNQVALVTFQARDLESTETLEGRQELLRIDAQIQLGNNKIEQTLWTDGAGQTHKSLMPALNQITYRTSKEVALSEAHGEFDLGERTVVRVNTAISQPHHTRRATYRVTMTRGDVAGAFTTGESQRVQRLDAQTAKITVRAVRPGQAPDAEGPRDEPPQAADRQSNSLVQSDDPQVRELAASVAPNQTDPWAIAVALEQQVKRYVGNKSFAQAMASAADVVRSREGDCTEHAVLLAALCRAREIPARVAIGLVYSPPIEGFAYHMWTEAWITDRWVPLDATLGLGGIGAAHLKVSHSNLEGVDPFSQFLPVFQLIGNVRIEVVSVE